MARNGVRVAIVGPRDWNDENIVLSFVTQIKAKHPRAVIISGGAPGVDTFAEKSAKRVALAYYILPADWDGPLKKRAGFERNTEIIEECEILVAFWNGISNGTRDTLEKGIAAKKTVLVIMPEKVTPFGREMRYERHAISTLEELEGLSR